MWLSVTFETDALHVEAFSDALLELGAISVGVEDADAGTEAERPQFGEPGSPLEPLWEHSRVIALFEPGADMEQIAAAATEAAGLTDQPPFQVAEIAEQNWVRLTQSQFEPIRINDRLWIVPSWHDAPDPAAINLVLDPGMAFGTGSHPTTRLCLEWLCRAVRPSDSVLDYGCGSGILAIAAARLGAASVTGVDIDPNALEAATANAERNGTALRLHPAEQAVADRFDLVVANILTNPLCVLAPVLIQLTRPGGRIGLSGILDTQVDKVRSAYEPGFYLQVAASLEGWVLLEGIRR